MNNAHPKRNPSLGSWTAVGCLRILSIDYKPDYEIPIPKQHRVGFIEPTDKWTCYSRYSVSSSKRLVRTKRTRSTFCAPPGILRNPLTRIWTALFTTSAIRPANDLRLWNESRARRGFGYVAISIFRSSENCPNTGWNYLLHFWSSGHVYLATRTESMR